MTKPVQLRTRTLGDSVVVDSILAINEIKEASHLQGHIAGGMAVQAYLDKSYHRPTIDTDFDLVWGGTSEEFRALLQPGVDLLRSKGYESTFQKQGLTHDWHITRDSESFLLQHAIRSRSNFEGRRNHSLVREAENAHTINGPGFTYRALAPEDIVVHKSSRIENFARRYRSQLPAIGAYHSLLSQTEQIREHIRTYQGQVDPSVVPQMRILLDCYDIISLAQNASLDKSYVEEAICDFSDVDKRASLRSILGSFGAR